MFVMPAASDPPANSFSPRCAKKSREIIDFK